MRNFEGDSKLSCLALLPRGRKRIGTGKDLEASRLGYLELTRSRPAYRPKRGITEEERAASFPAQRLQYELSATSQPFPRRPCKYGDSLVLSHRIKGIIERKTVGNLKIHEPREHLQPLGRSNLAAGNDQELSTLRALHGDGALATALEGVSGRELLPLLQFGKAVCPCSLCQNQRRYGVRSDYRECVQREIKERALIMPPVEVNVAINGDLHSAHEPLLAVVRDGVEISSRVQIKLLHLRESERP